MNSEPATNPVPPPVAHPDAESAGLDPLAPIDAGVLLRRFLACNPFYLASAALLLFGLYRVSVDPGLFQHEVLQLVFNLTSLQVYEAALVATAILLARRLLWYDSHLLLTVENVLVLVPFILISQASLINSRVVWYLCLVAGALVLGRFAALRRFIFPLNVPKPLLVIGAVTLAVNVALPIAYRVLHESKVGTKPDWGAAYYLNEYAWLLLLPVLCVLLGLIRVEHGRPEPLANSGWLPLGWGSLWLAGTVAHLYSLGYVYDFDLRRVLVAPAVWVLCWMLWFRGGNWWPQLVNLTKGGLMEAPLVATFLALTPGTPNWIHGTLVGVNMGIYGLLWLSRAHGRRPFHLMLLSAVLLAWVVPVDVGQGIALGFTQGKAVTLAAAIYGLGWSLCSRNPKLGLLGGVIVAALVGYVAPQNRDVVHWIFHAGLGYLLIHSLRWVDEAMPGAASVRIVAATVWGVHGVAWVASGGPALLAAIVPVMALCAYVVARLLAGRWFSLVIPGSAVLILLAAPGRWGAVHAKDAPAGFAAIAASFVLFGLGTVAALTRDKWAGRKKDEP